MANGQEHWRWPDGRPFDPQRYLFAPPPEKIGGIAIASSTLVHSRVWLKMFSGMGVSFRHTLGYLGDAGLACFECDGNPERLVRREVMIFSEAANLYASSTSEAFEFMWKDSQDRLLFRYSDKMPVVLAHDHIFHFLKAAESTWTNWLVEDAIHNLSRGGGLEFPVLGQGVLRLSRNTLFWSGIAIQQDHIESFLSNGNEIVVSPSYIGENFGFKGIQLNRGRVANAEALLKLLHHTFNLPAIS